MKTRINNILLAYDDHGIGLPVIFLHAFPLNRQMWAGESRALPGLREALGLDEASGVRADADAIEALARGLVAAMEAEAWNVDAVDDVIRDM